MTRARNRLVFCFCLKRDSGEAAEPSRFLFEAGAMHNPNAQGEKIGAACIAHPGDIFKKQKMGESFQTGLEVQRSLNGSEMVPEKTSSPFMGEKSGAACIAHPGDIFKKQKMGESFQTGLEVQRSLNGSEMVPEKTSAPSSRMSFIPKALELERAMCASLFGTDL
eukprot:symbB.v1.2.001582.t1/scaffold88.1/size340390/17